MKAAPLVIVTMFAGVWGLSAGPLSSACPAQTSPSKAEVIGSTREYGIRGELANTHPAPGESGAFTFESIEGAQWQHLWYVSGPGNPPRQISPRDSSDEYQAEADGEISWCPTRGADGHGFVFVSTGMDGNSDIYLGNTGDSVFVRLTRDGASEQHPRWSPDGRDLVFVSGRSGNGDLYVLPNASRYFGLLRENRAGGRVEASTGARSKVVDSDAEGALIRLTSNPDVDTSPEWSPAGRWIAYQAHVNEAGGRSTDILILDPRDPKRSPVRMTSTPDQDEMLPSWAPSGTGLAFYRSRTGSERDPASTVALIYQRFDSLSGCAIPLPQSHEATVIDESVVKNVTSCSPVWLAGRQVIPYLRQRGRETTMEVAEIHAKGAVTVKDIQVAGLPSPIQHRYLDVASDERATSLVVTSYAERDYVIYRSRFDTPVAMAKSTSVSDPLPRVSPGFVFGLTGILSTPAPWLWPDEILPGFGLFMEASRGYLFCTGSVPTFFSIRWTLAQVDLAKGGGNSAFAGANEFLASISWRFRVWDLAVYPYLGTGLTILFNYDGGRTAANIPFGWPLAAGMQLELSEKMSLDVTACHTAMNPEIFTDRSSTNPKHNFLDFRISLAFRLPSASNQGLSE
ncbi:MAG: PD40 domain-containing protein [Ignavibacteriae bacterium]|nr:PD40 domain-containing protein [Ignavibacteriota bacterium]